MSCSHKTPRVPEPPIGACLGRHLKISGNDICRVEWGHGSMRLVSGLRAEDPSEDVYQTAFRELSANVGAGFFLSTPSVYVATRCPTSRQMRTETPCQGQAPASPLWHGGFHAPKPGLVVQTNALVKATANAPLVVDLNVMWTWMDQIGAGFLFRAGESAGLVIQTRLSRSWKGMYSMDFPYNRLLVQSLGSHEIGLIWVPRDHAVVNARHF